MQEAKSYVQKATPPDQVAESDKTYRVGECEESAQSDTMRTAFCGRQQGTALPGRWSAMDLDDRRGRRARSCGKIREEMILPPFRRSFCGWPISLKLIVGLRIKWKRHRCWSLDGGQAESGLRRMPWCKSIESRLPHQFVQRNFRSNLESITYT